MNFPSISFLIFSAFLLFTIYFTYRIYFLKKEEANPFISLLMHVAIFGMAFQIFILIGMLFYSNPLVFKNLKIFSQGSLMVSFSLLATSSYTMKLKKGTELNKFFYALLILGFVGIIVNYVYSGAPSIENNILLWNNNIIAACLMGIVVLAGSLNPSYAFYKHYLVINNAKLKKRAIYFSLACLFMGLLFALHFFDMFLPSQLILSIDVGTIACFLIIFLALSLAGKKDV